ncbi:MULTISPECIES: hypothetical protein [unclassified Streptomyces]|uniref:hypothetical protein n=1 Tax=unclassified Streptomyces TaxID=2593676 RepID=UPI003D90E9B0
MWLPASVVNRQSEHPDRRRGQAPGREGGGERVLVLGHGHGFGRKLFGRMSWFLPLLRPTGLAPRMTAAQQADSNIELGRLSPERDLAPVLDDITVPVRYVVASGTSFGSRGDEQEQIRTSLDAVRARNPHIQIGAKVASNHGAILKKDFPAIAAAVREVAALDHAGH